jgi:hypothetical protein
MTGLDDQLRQVPAPDAPPIAPALEAMLDGLAPVAPRRPWRDLGKVGGLSLAYGAALLAVLTVRRDVDGIPTWWIVSHAIAWSTGFVGLAYVAIVPRRGAVMPRWRSVGLGTALVCLGFVAAGLFMPPEPSPDTRLLDLSTLHRGHACLEIGLATAIVPILLGALVLRGALPVGARWTAAGLGAAGGSLGGLVLHLHCPIADRWHLGLVHGGMVILAAVIAAALVPRVVR